MCIFRALGLQSNGRLFSGERAVRLMAVRSNGTLFEPFGIRYNGPSDQWAALYCTRGCVPCIRVCVCVCLNSTPLLLGNSTPLYWVVLVIVWLHSQTGSRGIKIKEKLLNDQSSVNSLNKSDTFYCPKIRGSYHIKNAYLRKSKAYIN